MENYSQTRPIDIQVFDRPSTGWKPTVIMPNGDIYGVENGIVLKHDMDNLTSEVIMDIEDTTYEFFCLALTGKIYGVSNTSTPSVCEIDLETKEKVFFGNAYSGDISGMYITPSGKLYVIPGGSNVTVMEIDPVNRTDTVFNIPNISGDNLFKGAVLGSNGRLYIMPQNALVMLELDPLTKTFVQVKDTNSDIIGGSKFSGCALAKDACVYSIPDSADKIYRLNTSSKVMLKFGTIEEGVGKWSGGVLAPNNKIYCIPKNADKILEIDPIDQVTNTLGPEITDSFTNGRMYPNCKIYAYNDNKILMIDLGFEAMPEIDTLVSPFINHY
ncbi:MAG: hypothetical protein ACRCX2_30810 [Paraclostridium sp.]